MRSTDTARLETSACTSTQRRGKSSVRTTRGVSVNLAQPVQENTSAESRVKTILQDSAPQVRTALAATLNQTFRLHAPTCLRPPQFASSAHRLQASVVALAVEVTTSGKVAATRDQIRRTSRTLVVEEVTKAAAGTVTNSMVEVADIKHLEEEVEEVEERLPEETWTKFFVSSAARKDTTRIIVETAMFRDIVEGLSDGTAASLLLGKKINLHY